MKKRWEALRRAARFNYLKLLRMKASTHSIAVGLAAGIFIGFMPIIPFQTVAAIALAFVVRGSKLAAALATWISNAANLIPFYTMLYFVGKSFLPFDVAAFDPNNLTMEALFKQGWDIFATMVVGGVVLGIPASFLTYVIGFRLINAHRRRRMIRLIKKYQSRQREKAEGASGNDSMEGSGS